MPDPVSGATAFVRHLRAAGLSVSIDATLTFVAALEVVDLADPTSVYWAARSTLIRRVEDVDTFDAAFVAWFASDAESLDGDEQAAQSVTLAVDDPDADLDGGEDVSTGGDTLQVRFSTVETLRHKDFAAYDDDEMAEAYALMARLRFQGAPRRSRREVPAGGVTRRPDLRRTVRASLRTGGEPIRRAYTKPGTRLRRVVLLVDVSGSMEAYARPLLRFVQAAVAARSRVEAFALGTRLTRMTRELSRRDPDDALARAAAAVEDMAGGTRLGDGLAAFNDRWGVRGMARGAVVVILSDGWDRGDPDRLGAEMARLQRVAHKVVWVNPLKSTPGYAPLARGMAAAMPSIDVFVEGHSIAALEDLAAVIAGADPAPSDRRVVGAAS